MSLSFGWCDEIITKDEIKKDHRATVVFFEKG
jgi:hypothetical protein